MRYKENWELTKERLTAFWNRELLDRCCLRVNAADRRLPELLEPYAAKTPADVLRQRTDADFMIEKNRLIMEHTYYVGEAFPIMPLDLGASGHAGFFQGADYRIEDTVWFFPSLRDPAELTFDENSFLYQKTLDLARAFAQDSGGDYMISMPDTTGNADALSHLMGPEELLPAMLDDPDAVHQALNKIQSAYERIMTECYDIVKDTNEGGSTVAWLGTWAPGFHAQMQSDMSVMISAPMFKEFILPELEAQCRLLDYPMYHFDGIEQIRHLDMLLSIPRLKAIQWTQVVGQPPCTQYIPELRRIQQAGKNLIIHVTPDQIPILLENLSSRGLLLLTGAATPEDADDLLKLAARMAHD